MLVRVEETSLGIAACPLPPRDDGAVGLVEFAVDLGVEAETGQPALHVATLSLVEADPIFGFLIASSAKIAGSTDVERSRVAVLGPALPASALTRILRTDNARRTTSIGLFFLLPSLDDFAFKTDVGSNTPP